MELDLYQAETEKTAVYGNHIHDALVSCRNAPGENMYNFECALRLNYAIVGLGGEVGELQNKWQKFLRGDSGQNVFYPGDAIKKSLIVELGGVLYFLARVAEELDVDLSTVALENLKKLLSRKERGVINGNGDER
jgi:NTP pyrophosphatase (non-canonical NTP hydrolase)